MKKITLYHIAFKDYGANFTFAPYIPSNTAQCEDDHTKRICCSNTITGCIYATEMVESVKGNKSLNFWIYKARVPVENVHQPNCDQVPDVWSTGEFWVTKPQQFDLMYHGKIRKQMNIEMDFYSRYAVTSTDVDEVIDRQCATNLYGNRFSFSFIEVDGDKRESYFKKKGK